MQITFFELENWEKDFFEKKLGQNHKLKFFEKALTSELIPQIQNTEILVVFIYSKVTREIIDMLPNLKMIATMSTGIDHIDTEYAKQKNIKVSNVSGYGEITVAEHTFALILSLSRRILESHHRVKEQFFSPEGLTGFDLFGKTLGVIGVGSIGKHVIEIANGFGMNVIGYARHPDTSLGTQLKFKFVDLEILFKQSDIISLHVPYTDETHHMINDQTIGKMKKGVYIINTARGGVVDTAALLRGITSGQIGGVGLDVIEGEPILREEKELLSREFKKEDLLSVLHEHMLLNYPNVVLTPHNAFNSREALEKILETTEENINGFVSGLPKNVV